MKKLMAVFFVLLFFPLAFAVNLNVVDLDSDKVMIIGLNEPTYFQINVTNNGASDYFSFYTFFEGGMDPKSPVFIAHGETKTIDVALYPRLDSKLRGFSAFNYYIQGTDKSEVQEKSMINLIELQEAIGIYADPVGPDSTTTTLYIENKNNFKFSNVSVEIVSPFFETNKQFSLMPYEVKKFVIDLDKSQFNNLVAGYYTFKSKVKVEDVSASIEGKIEFVEKELLVTNTKNTGTIISKKIIEKVNNGNTILESSSTVKENIFSRLFIVFSPEPDVVERHGTTVYYTWNQKINPGESEKIVITTNWIIPFLLIFFIVAVIFLVKKYATQKLVLRKRVSFVRAKGGEFALKVTLIAEAREFVEKVKIVDRLPPLVKMYEKFAGEFPDRITKDQRRLEWEFDHLEAGEKRVMNYVVYSKVGVLGKFALPSAVGLYQRDGKMYESNSNKAYFVSEQKSKSSFN